MHPFGDGALCFSIPNLLYLRDTDNDGVCDRREVVLGPFDTTRDTHGMVNSLRMGEDGWVYACHGFNNQSRIQGTDGHAISMTSGNVFRFRPDGSRVELFSQGQVNPFGLARDRWGFWYAADCHSKPISQLILGGCHPSFGRPDDGLGFVPPMMDHLHGSTAIAGLVHTKDSRFPIPFQDNFLSGNVMTCQNTGAKGAHKIGHVADFDAIVLDTATHFAFRPECMACPVVQLCKGSCMFLEGDFFAQSCANEFAFNMAIMMAAIWHLTGMVVVRIGG
jgi:radical SAM protein with 4Fe4S-binding SPASM domain